jgi:choice-of-anchor B domain-containing protein
MNMKTIYLSCLFLLINFYSFAQLNIELVGNLRYDKFVNDIWGYTAPDSTEYALVGTDIGVSVVSLADPANPKEVAFIGGLKTRWRDLKTQGSFAYITSEAQEGLLILDFTDLPNKVTSRIWKTTLEGKTDSLGNCHNLFIDENGYCYLSGCGINKGGLIILDVFSTPGTPKLVGTGPDTYSHDVYVRNNIAYSAEIEDGIMKIYDVTDKKNLKLLGSQETPFKFSHNTWLSDDGKTVFTTDEKPNAPTAAYDVSDPKDIKELNQFVPAATKGKGVIPHNVHVLNDYLIISHYGDGCVIVDAHRPDNLIEVGNYDTSPSGVGGFVGAWGAYPFLPSGLILTSDSENGLFVLKPTYQRAAYLEGTVKDSVSGKIITAASVSMATIVVNTDLKGNFKTGRAEEGTVEVLISKPGYKPKTVQVDLTRGMVQQLDVQLVPAAKIKFVGMVLSDDNSTGINGAKIRLFDSENTINIESGENGTFTFNDISEGNYTMQIGKWGYKTTNIANFVIGTTTTMEIRLKKGIDDPFLFDLGWKVENSSEVVQSGGKLELGVPITDDLELIKGDVGDDLGNQCYLTGNTSNGDSTFLVKGTVKLTSPIFDLSTMVNPKVKYYTNFSNINFNTFGSGKDTLYVYLNNGTKEAIIEKITSIVDFESEVSSKWTASEIKVKDHLEPTANMSIRFEHKVDDDVNVITKLGIDYFQAFDGQTVSTTDVLDEKLLFNVFPNPFQSSIMIDYQSSDWEGEGLPQLIIYNAFGQKLLERKVSKLQPIDLPSDWQTGLYLMQLSNDNRSSKVMKIMKF